MATIWQMLAFGAALYAALVGLVFVFQDRMVFFPEVGRAVVATPADFGLDYERVTLTAADGVRLEAWFVPVREARGVVLVFNGNAGNRSMRLDYARMFARLGWSTLLFDYRGYGGSEGKPDEAGTYRDADAAWAYLVETRRIPPGSVVLLGESLGGPIAARLAARERPAALILASTFTSLPDLGAELYPWLPVRLLARTRYDTLASVREVRVPVLVAHSRDDEIVPVAHGRRLHEAAREPKAFVEMRGGHNDGFLFARKEWSDAVGEFLATAGTPAVKGPE